MVTQNYSFLMRHRYVRNVKKKKIENQTYLRHECLGRVVNVHVFFGGRLVPRGKHIFFAKLVHFRNTRHHTFFGLITLKKYNIIVTHTRIIRNTITIYIDLSIFIIFFILDVLTCVYVYDRIWSYITSENIFYIDTTGMQGRRY